APHSGLPAYGLTPFRVSVAVCEPFWSTQVTDTCSPALWDLIAVPSVSLLVILELPTFVIAEFGVMPADSAGEPDCTVTTSAPDETFRPSLAATSAVRSRTATPMKPTWP